ncbi:ATP synthase F0 [Clohesyomyces aquaticus]|uniref:ATP synthase F0 n=1 Tax=Clohesyomyces aquaticus TaxID=1231657 RepID=A0A1Y1YUM9_9PLEO|nr:ATP synthase F0 [Clohesyomyces aquaticus]
MPENGGTESAGRGLHSLNPFTRHEEFSRESLLMYKITTTITWLILVITSFFYTFSAPHDGKYPRRTIWGQNHVHNSPFAMNPIIVSIYWIILFVLQFIYTLHLYSSNSVYVSAAANVGSHFIANNLLLFGFIHLWVRSYFWLAELLLIINFFNLSFAYFRHSTTPRIIHIGVVSGPLAWNFVALYWCGAVMVHAHNLPARIVANIFIWAILAYGMFFLVAYKDYTMGFNLSILAAAIGVSQFLVRVIAFQWIFAFVIMGVLFVLSLAVGVPGLLGRDPFERGQIVSEDRERAPLLADE